MNNSLEGLVENLKEEGVTYFKNFRREFGCDEKALLLLRKGVYPYEYVDRKERFDDTQLPEQNAFYNHLRKSHISDNEYQHAQSVWKTFKLQDLGSYHDLYLKTGVLLLADCFERFRDICESFYSLDPCHFHTAPGLSWQAALKMTKVKLKLLTDPDMYLFFERAIRGGMSVIAHRHVKANNPYIPENYDQSAPNTYMLYADCCNLYGKALASFLPTGGFQWLAEREIDTFDVTKIPPDRNTGFLLEVDLEYEDFLHDEHNDYPLPPESLTITDSRNLWDKLNSQKDGRKRTNVKKLVSTLGSRNHYVVHYRNIQQYLELGLKVSKIHKVLSFDQSPWLKPYIDFNTQKRKESKNEFVKDFLSL